MAKRFAWISRYYKENLLARLRDLSSLILPVVNKTSVSLQHNLIARMNFSLPVSPGLVSRARNLCVSRNSGMFAQAMTFSRQVIPPVRLREMESSAVYSSKLSAGRSFSCNQFACSTLEKTDRFCCPYRGDCGCKPRKWLLPLASSSYLPLRPSGQMTAKRLHVIRDPGNCVLGVLACGYVIRGAGSNSSRFQKRA